MDYSCTSKYFLANQIEKTTTEIIIETLMILDLENTFTVICNRVLMI